MDYQKIIEEKMKNMEMSPNKRKSMSVDALKSADHTSISLDAVKKKYKAAGSVASADSETTQYNKEQSSLNEDIEVKLIRNKDKSVDASDLTGERTIIFNKGGGIIGSQG